MYLLFINLKAAPWTITNLFERVFLRFNFISVINKGLVKSERSVGQGLTLFLDFATRSGSDFSIR